MNIWDATSRAGRAGVTTARRELAAAWRSLRYDLRRAGRPATPAGGAGATDPGTGGAYEAYVRGPGRLRTAAVVAALAFGGAAATYAGVAGGLSALPGDQAGDPGGLPGVAAERPAADLPPAGPGWHGSQATVPSPDPLPPVLPAADPEPVGPPPVGTPRTPEPDHPAALPEPVPESTPTPAPAPSPTPSPTRSVTPSPSATCECPSEPPPAGGPADRTESHQAESTDCDDTTDGHQS